MKSVTAPAPVIAHMPDGTPAPHVMTAEQVCAFLQLEVPPTGAMKRLRTLRTKGGLVVELPLAAADMLLIDR